MRGLTYLETGVWEAQRKQPTPCTRDNFTLQLSDPRTGHNVHAAHIFAANFEAALHSGYYGDFKISSTRSRRDEIVSAFTEVIQYQFQAQNTKNTENQHGGAKFKDTQNRRDARRIAVSNDS
jgi:hypothetical protein